MAALNSYMKTVAGLIAVAVMAGSASAATTWSGGAGTNATSRNAWLNSTNWTNGVPSASNDATFGASSYLAPNVGTASSVLGVTFTSAAPSYTIGGQTLTVGAGGITQNSANAQTFSNTLQIGSSLQVSGTSSAANVINFKTINSTAQGNVVTVGNVTANFVENNPTTVAPELTVASGGVVNILNGSGGSSVFGDVIVQGNGKIDISDNTSLQAESYTALSNSVTEIDLAYPTPAGGYITTSGDVSYGGSVVFNWSAASLANQTTFTNYADVWNAFQASGSYLNTGNITSVSVVGLGGANAFSGYTTFNQNGTEWTTQATPNAAGQWLVFQPQNGNLVVVPEPSTIVFAGVGVAMAGWSAWKKRRLAKVLAKK